MRGLATGSLATAERIHTIPKGKNLCTSGLMATIRKADMNENRQKSIGAVVSCSRAALAERIKIEDFAIPECSKQP